MLEEKYFRLKGMFLELKEKMEEEERKYISLGLSHGVIYFDNFKLKISSVELEEMALVLYFEDRETASINIEYEDDFNFYYDEVALDFVEGRDKAAC